MAVIEIRSVFKIRSSDGQIFAVEDWFIKKSKCFSIVVNYMKDFSLPLQTTISSFVLIKIIRWCYHHRNDDSDRVHNGIPAWDAHFLRINNNILLHLIEAAFRLEIRGLLDMACRAVSITSGRTLNEVKIILRVASLEEESEEDEHLEGREGNAEMLPAFPTA